jgi:hypothetical protein
MATQHRDNIVVEYQPPISYPIKVDGTADINGGDLVYFDTGAFVVKSLDSDAHAATFAGIAKNGSFIQPYNTKQYGAGQIPVAQKALVNLNTTAGDTLHEDDAVYFGADAQTVTNTAGGMTHKLGYVKLGAGYTGQTLAGGAGITVNILLAVQDPTSAFA